MFYEDFRVGQSADSALRRSPAKRSLRTDDGSIRASSLPPLREASLSPPRGCMWRLQAMRRLVDTRNALRAAMTARGKSLPELGVSPGFREMRGRTRCMKATLSPIRWRPCRSADFQGEMGADRQQISGVNQRGEEVLVFSSVVLVARRQGNG